MVSECLERALGNYAWTFHFPNATVHLLPFIPISHHFPLLLNTAGCLNARKKGKIGWRYERWWTSLQCYQEVLTSVWNSFPIFDLQVNLYYHIQNLLRQLHS